MTEYPNGKLPAKFQRRRKQFVEVVASHKLDGSVCPQTIILSDGRRYEIEVTRDPFCTELEGEKNMTTVYPVSANGDATFLFECAGRWHVLMKN